MDTTPAEDGQEFPVATRTVDDIVGEANMAIWKDAEYFTPEDVFILVAALAAERDRADRAEAALHAAWSRGQSAGFSVAMRRMSDEPGAPDPVNPYHIQATA